MQRVMVLLFVLALVAYAAPAALAPKRPARLTSAYVPITTTTPTRTPPATPTRTPTRTPTSSQVDVWLSGPHQAGGPPLGIVILPMEYGNSGLTTASSAIVTVTLSKDLSFLPSDPPPSWQSGNVAQWNLPNLPFAAHGWIVLRVGLPNAVYGTHYGVTAHVTSDELDTWPYNNSISIDVLIGRQIMLPAIVNVSTPDTITYTPTVTPTPTRHVSQTPTHTPSRTATPTRTPTRTPTPSRTVTTTCAPGHCTPGPSCTPSRTHTATRTPTYAPTYTPTPTSTPTPTATPCAPGYCRIQAG